MDPSGFLARPQAAVRANRSWPRVSAGPIGTARQGGEDRVAAIEARMRPLIRVAARLYPKAWRTRYGSEFAALLEDIKPGWGGFLDIVKGALAMQVLTWNFGRIV